MLNEAHELWQALVRCKIPFEDYVPGFDRCKEEDGVRVFLCPEGQIKKLEMVPAEKMVKIRVCNLSGAGTTLPVFNFDALHNLSADDSKAIDKEFKRLKDRSGDSTNLAQLLKTAAGKIAWKANKVTDLGKAFKIVSHRISLIVQGNPDPHGDGWRELLKTVCSLQAETFLANLSAAVRNHILASKSDSSHPIWLKLLKGGSLPVQFEPFCERGFRAPVYSKEAHEWLRSLWLAAILQGRSDEIETSKPSDKPKKSNLKQKAHAEKLPPLWGDSMDWDRAFKPMPLSVLGKISLFSKDNEVRPTSGRYGVGGTESFRGGGSDVRVKLMGALDWLLDDSRRDATWTFRQLASGGKKGGKKQSKFFLLLAYPNQLSETPPRLACLFGGDASSQANRAELRFESVSQSVVAALDGILKTAPNAQINVFAIHKPDPGRAQVFFSEVMAAAQLRELAAAWQRDARQYPPIVISQFPSLGKEEWQRRKKEKITTNPENYEPAIPFPYDVVECLNTVWQKCTSPAETKIDEAQDASLSDAFELLRSDGPKADVHYLARLLELAVRRATPLLLAVGQAAHQRGHRVFAPPKASAKCVFQSLRWPPILGLLLTRLNYKLETYMTESAYLIGRLLAQVDRLHSYYALHVSGKEQMTQLLGNSLMAVALDQPRQAFELLGQRILPYQAWGTSFSRGNYADPQKQKDANAVGGILWELGQIAAELARRTIPEENVASLPAREGHESRPPANHLLDAKNYAWMSVGSAAKAQMLLGYLARPPKKSSDVDRGGADSLPGFDVDAVPLSSASSEASTQTTKA